MSHAAAPPRVAWTGGLVFVVSDAITFLALLGAALTLRGEAREWSAGALASAGQLAVLSLLLFGGSGALFLARGRAPKAFYGLAGLLSALFVVGEVLEWRALVAAGQGPGADLRHASLFVVTGLHAIHVAIGAALALVYALRGATQNTHRVLSLYFGALDLAWIFIILVVYR